MNNFYTATVYEKGAKVVHMLRTILGEKKLQDGMKLYLQLMTAKLRAAKISSKPCKMPIRSICKVFCLGIVLQVHLLLKRVDNLTQRISALFCI